MSHLTYKSVPHPFASRVLVDLISVNRKLLEKVDWRISRIEERMRERSAEAPDPQGAASCEPDTRSSSPPRDSPECRISKPGSEK